MKTILGIDPGLAKTGYGIIRIDNRSCSHIEHGVISTPSTEHTGKRLVLLYEKVSELITRFTPDEAAIEKLFFVKNISSAIPVAQACGVLFYLFELKGIPVGEYTPKAIKQAVVGTGSADKRQVQELVKMLLGMKQIPQPDHAADALAVSVCHFNNWEARGLS